MRAARVFAALLVLAWLALLPLVRLPPDSGLPAQRLMVAGLLAAAGVGLAARARLHRTGPEDAGGGVGGPGAPRARGSGGGGEWRRSLPVVVAVGLALASLALNLATRPAAWPREEVARFALVGALHALAFLALFALAPRPEEGEGAARDARRLLGGLLAAIALGQVVTCLSTGAWGEDVVRLQGTLGNPNVLATVLAAAWIGICALSGWRLRVLAATAPLLPFILLTRSRGGLAALAGALLVLAVRRRRRRILLLVTLGVLALVLLPNPLRARVQAMQAEHAFSRPFLWAAAATRLADEPLGIGPGMNKYFFPRVAYDPARPWLLHQRHEVGLTHNVFLTLGLEWGWLALAALAGLAAWAAVRAWRAPRRDDPLRHAALLAALVVFLELQVDTPEQNPFAFVLFLLLVALGLARLPAAGPPRRDGAAPGRAGRRALWFAAAAAFVVAGLLVVRAARDLSVSAAFRAAEALAARAGSAPVAPGRVRAPDAPGEPVSVDQVRAALDAAEAASPGALRPVLFRFRLERDRVRAALDAGESPDAPEVRAAISAALAASDRARAANGLDPELPRDAARLLIRLYRIGRNPSWFERYAAAVQATLALDPLDVEALWDLAREAQRAHRPDLAEQALADLFRLEPDQAEAWWVTGRLRQAAGDREGALHDYVRADEALWNVRQKLRVGSPASQAYYQRLLAAVDLAELRARKAALRRVLYFEGPFG